MSKLTFVKTSYPPNMPGPDMRFVYANTRRLRRASDALMRRDKKRSNVNHNSLNGEAEQ